MTKEILEEMHRLGLRLKEKGFLQKSVGVERAQTWPGIGLKSEKMYENIADAFFHGCFLKNKWSQVVTPDKREGQKGTTLRCGRRKRKGAKGGTCNHELYEAENTGVH